MTTTAEQLKPALLALPEADRWELVAALLDSLPAPDGAADEDEDAEWADEINRRVAEIRAGRARMVPGDAVMGRLREKFG